MPEEGRGWGGAGLEGRGSGRLGVTGPAAPALPAPQRPAPFKVTASHEGPIAQLMMIVLSFAGCKNLGSLNLGRCLRISGGTPEARSRLCVCRASFLMTFVTSGMSLAGSRHLPLFPSCSVGSWTLRKQKPRWSLGCKISFKEQYQ